LSGLTLPLSSNVATIGVAYAPSIVAVEGDGTIYLLFERGQKKLYEKVALARFNLEWLADGRDWHGLLEE